MKINDIMKFAGKWIEMEKKIIQVKYLRPRKKNTVVITYTWILALKTMFDNQAVIHRPTNGRYRVRDYRETDRE